jgi:hypothetical protein
MCINTRPKYEFKNINNGEDDIKKRNNYNGSSYFVLVKLAKNAPKPPPQIKKRSNKGKINELTTVPPTKTSEVIGSIKSKYCRLFNPYMINVADK